MSNDEFDDAITSLISLGILVLIGAGIFKVLKSIADYEEGATISSTQAEALAPYIPLSSNYGKSPIYKYCNSCGRDTKQCQLPYHYGNNRCINCNYGYCYEDEQICGNCD